MRLALDIPGGDHNRPQEQRVSAAMRAIRQIPDLEILFVGIKGQISRLLAPFTGPERDRSEIHEADSVVDMNLTGKELLKFVGQERRNDRHTSIFAATDLVQSGKADAILSSGNTGGIALAAKKQLSMLPDVHTPAIVTLFPTRIKDRYVGLGDSGLIIDRTQTQIAEATLITAALVHTLLDIKTPRVGLLSNGSERGKGREGVVKTDEILREITPHIPGIHYLGNVEPHDIFHAHVDAVGADGFDANVGLKFAEAAGKLVQDVIKEELKSGWKIGQMLTWLINRNKFKRAKKRLSVDQNAVGWIIGPDGLVFKVHGDADEEKYLAGIIQAAHLTKENPLDGMKKILPNFLKPLREWEESHKPSA